VISLIKEVSHHHLLGVTVEGLIIL